MESIMAIIVSVFLFLLVISPYFFYVTFPEIKKKKKEDLFHQEIINCVKTFLNFEDGHAYVKGEILFFKNKGIKIGDTSFELPADEVSRLELYVLQMKEL